VVIGLIGESKKSKWIPERPSFHVWHWIFIGMVIFGVAAEFITDGMIFDFSHRLQTLQEKEVFTLESHLAARTLNDKQSALMVSRLSKAIPPDVGQISYVFSATSDEEIAFAYDLSDGVFAKIGWDWKEWTVRPRELRITLPRQERVIGWIPLSGVQIQSLNPKLDGVVMALVDALKEIGIEGARTDPSANAIWQTSNGPMYIAIMIGMKPSLRLPAE
jgi:hypothetical protein